MAFLKLGMSPHQIKLSAINYLVKERICMEIIQRFIPVSNKETRPGIKMNPQYITIHETDNTSPGANAEAHARLQVRGNDREASWHVQVDDKEAIQSIPFNEVAWAAGDGPNGPGNLTSIHIEICVNEDGNYKKAVQNAAEVTRQLMKQYTIPVSKVVQHNYWSGKNCPQYLRSGEKGVNWSGFVSSLKEPEKVLWDGVELKPGQIGRITILKPIKLWTRDKANNLVYVRGLNPGEVYRVYGYSDDYFGQYNVGANHWITNMKGYVKYETPSQAKLEAVKRLNE